MGLELGWLYLQRGELPMALSTLSDEVTRNPLNIEAHCLLLECSWTVKRFDEMKFCARKNAATRPLIRLRCWREWGCKSWMPPGCRSNWRKTRVARFPFTTLKSLMRGHNNGDNPAGFYEGGSVATHGLTGWVPRRAAVPFVSKCIAGARDAWSP